MERVKKYRVLHLEDSPLYIEMFKELINQLGNVEYQYVYNANEAFERLKEQLPDLMIVDLMLGQDYDTEPGEMFVKKAAAEYPYLKMMVLTGWADDDDPYERLKDYIIHYEKKAFRPSKFKTTLTNLLVNPVKLLGNRNR